MLFKFLTASLASLLIISAFNGAQIHAAISKETIYDIAAWTSSKISNYTGLDVASCKFRRLTSIVNVRPNLLFTKWEYILTIE